jgi:predicted alpha/beta-hydrolase family hydrolase
MDDRSTLAVSRSLRAPGLDVLRFNFLYKAEGLRRPDPMPTLRACMDAVMSMVLEKVQAPRLILGGRSMGGRVATHLAADGYPCDGVLLLAYPLHPAGQTDKLRAAHLPRIQVPVLCFNGTRDSLCRRDLMETVLQELDRWTMHWLESADHGFHVTKTSGRTDQDVLEEIAQKVASWIPTLPPRGKQVLHDAP